MNDLLQSMPLWLVLVIIAGTSGVLLWLKPPGWASDGLKAVRAAAARDLKRRAPWKKVRLVSLPPPEPQQVADENGPQPEGTPLESGRPPENESGSGG